MAARQVHLVRHGEVYNPDGVLYGRLPGYGLSALGQKMAEAAARDLLARERHVGTLIASPLLRTQQSAAPHARAFGLETTTDARLIEPSNHFEGTVLKQQIRKATAWPWLVNPLRPSWGEAYRSIANRMRAALDDAFNIPTRGDVILVSHQLPIWITHLSVAKMRYVHNPRHRRCNLSSITSFGKDSSGTIVEIGYSDPGITLAEAGANSPIDVGAV